MDYGGNITDAAALATIASLLHFRKPMCSINGRSVVIHSNSNVILHLSVFIIFQFVSPLLFFALPPENTSSSSNGQEDKEDDMGDENQYPCYSWILLEVRRHFLMDS